MMLRLTTILFATSAFFAIAPTAAWAHGDFEHAVEAEAKHHFALAEHHLRNIVERDPRDAQAWLSLASLETVRGDISAAREACAVATRQLDPVVALACRGRLALADAESKADALDDLQPLLAHPAFRARNDELALWTVGVAAELAAAVGQDEEADRYFERVIANDPPTHIEAAYLDHLLATARPYAVIAYAEARDTSLAVELRRALALVAIGAESSLQGMQQRLHETFLHWIEDGDFTHGREMAMFYLDVMPQPALASRAATENLKYQREPEDRALYRRATGQEPDGRSPR